MGLCKCPKRKVTNQFCFEHRVNVCEHCMVTNHPKCVVQSYLLWLQDSDCNPICTFCSELLTTRDCIRLTCYHVYHWSCLNNFVKNLPTNEAANYSCPTCNLRIIPQSNLVSPVADVLREKLAQVNWARPSLGLDVLAEEAEEKSTKAADNAQSSYQNHSTSLAKPVPRTSGTANSIPHHINANNAAKLGPPYSVVNIDTNTAVSSSSSSSRKVFEAYDDPKEFLFDHDENKYQRKSAVEWFLRWWKLITRGPARRRNMTGSIYKKYAFILILGIGIFVCILMIFSWLGKIATDGDPSYNAINNPMIQVNDENS